jgi:hypothetical protein
MTTWTQIIINCHYITQVKGPGDKKKWKKMKMLEEQAARLNSVTTRSRTDDRRVAKTRLKTHGLMQKAKKLQNNGDRQVSKKVAELTSREHVRQLAELASRPMTFPSRPVVAEKVVTDSIGGSWLATTFAPLPLPSFATGGKKTNQRGNVFEVQEPASVPGPSGEGKRKRDAQSAVAASNEVNKKKKKEEGDGFWPFVAPGFKAGKKN